MTNWKSEVYVGAFMFQVTLKKIRFHSDLLYDNRSCHGLLMGLRVINLGIYSEVTGLKIYEKI